MRFLLFDADYTLLDFPRDMIQAFTIMYGACFSAQREYSQELLDCYDACNNMQLFLQTVLYNPVSGYLIYFLICPRTNHDHQHIISLANQLIDDTQASSAQFDF